MRATKSDREEERVSSGILLCALLEQLGRTFAIANIDQLIRAAAENGVGRAFATHALESVRGGDQRLEAELFHLLRLKHDGLAR